MPHNMGVSQHHGIIHYTPSEEGSRNVTVFKERIGRGLIKTSTDDPSITYGACQGNHCDNDA